jgi:hypothetical protein
MSAAVVVALPVSRRGRRSAEQESAYQAELEQFAARIREINSTLEFQISSRGWCYILEEHGLTKGEFDRAQQLLNDCRKSGLLPLNICKEDDARAVSYINPPGGDFRSAAQFAEDIVYRVERELDEARERIELGYLGARDACYHYAPIGWYEELEYSVFCLVEKIDLLTLFTGVCNRFHVPIANAKGWCDLHLRAAMAEYFADAEEQGRTPVLLYCGDHDPAGLLISSTIKKNLADLSRATGWSPENLIVDRFGLNADFIDAQGLSWIDNLESGSGKDLSASGKDYVREYIAQFGKRKVEANTLVTRPDAARELIADAIAKYIPEDWGRTLKERNKPAQREAFAEFDRQMRERRGDED